MAKANLKAPLHAAGMSASDPDSGPAPAQQRVPEPPTSAAAPHRKSAERDWAAGHAARGRVPRREHAIFLKPERDAVGILAGQHVSRLPELVPVRVGRMLQTPFSFFRGAAAVMAHDLAVEPVTGYMVLASGDAHLANFGIFASPERRLLFDLNDFDESYPAPWEWDVKRLAASIWIHGRTNSHTEEQCRSSVLAGVNGYREAIRRLCRCTAAERYYFQVAAERLAAKNLMPRRTVRAQEKKARRRTSEQVISKLTTITEDGGVRIVDQPPVVVHREIGGPSQLEEILGRYRASLRIDVSVLLSQYRLIDYALKVVGVGSVGMRCWIFLLEGPAGEPLFLQAKEAGRSVLETYGGISKVPDPVVQALTTGGQGYRVVGSQWILQAQSDPFLGWIKDVTGSDGIKRDFYIRQFRDMKGSFNLPGMNAAETAQYARVCGSVLARAHSQFAGSSFIAGYLGQSPIFEESLGTWARHYADQTEADYAQLQREVRRGRLPAETGV